MAEPIGLVYYGPRLTRLVEEIERLLATDLDFDFGLDDDGEIQVRAETRVARDLGSIISQSLQDNRAEAHRIRMRILYFVKHLREVGRKAPSVLDDFRSAFQRRGADSGNFWGLMFEVETAASLLRKGVSFRRPDPPDFLVLGGKIGIECTACTTGRGSTPPVQRLREKLTTKGAKDYLSLSDAVFVETTGIHFSSAGAIDTSPEFLSNKLKGGLSSAAHSKEIGAVIAFTNFVHDSGKIETVYSRVDHLRIENALRGFLDGTYPFGNKRVDLGRVSYLDRK